MTAPTEVQDSISGEFIEDYHCGQCGRHFWGGGIVVERELANPTPDEVTRQRSGRQRTVAETFIFSFCVECVESAVRQAKAIGDTDEDPRA